VFNFAIGSEAHVASAANVRISAGFLDFAAD